MPEGPEIRLAADSVAAVLVGEILESAELALPRLKRFRRRLQGSTVTAIDTRGKAMLTRFDNGLTLYSHNQLYGRWYVTARPKLPQTNRQLRVALHTRTHSALLYSATDIDILTVGEIAAHPFLSRIGPDVLDPELTPMQIVDRLRSSQFSGRALGSLYLDQGFIAGIGNYLRTEILWSARANPLARPKNLRRSVLYRLAAATLRIAHRSYRTRGVTVARGLMRDLKTRGLDYEAYRFYAFGRNGLACHRCGATIMRQSHGSRNIFVCPGCQDV